MTSSNSIKNSLDITGLKFNRLTAVEKTTRRSGKHVVWKFLCDCGKEHFATATDVKRGQTTSCGCALRDFLVKTRVSHGATRGAKASKLYMVWSGMRRRCSDPKTIGYSSYGARGITVCERWSNFANFRDDMGNPEPGLTLDRIDVNGNYEPSNCRWATPKQQAENRRSNSILEIDGVSQCISEWAAASGTNPNTIWYRKSKGYSHSDCVYLPPNFRNRAA